MTGKIVYHPLQHRQPPPPHHSTRVEPVRHCRTLPKRNEKMSEIIQPRISASCLQL